MSATDDVDGVRRHLLSLRQSVDALSNHTNAIKHDLSTALLQARLRKEETLKLTDQFRALQAQFDAATKRSAQIESTRLTFQADLAKRLDIATERIAQTEIARHRGGEALRRQFDVVRRHAERDRIPPEVLQDVSASLADMASFIEEVEIQQGWSQSIPRDRGIDRMRQLAMKLYTMAKAMPPQPPSDT